MQLRSYIIVIIFFFILLTISSVLGKNNVVYYLGDIDANEQMYFYLDPNDPNHRSDRIFIGSDSKTFILIEVQYDVTFRDVCQYWLTDEPLADFNADEVVNLVDFAIWIKEK